MSTLKIFAFALLLTFSGMLYAEKLNINTADAEQIATELSGIGAVRAEAIVNYRKQNGKFDSIDELANVPGVGEKTLEKNRGNITLSMSSKK